MKVKKPFVAIVGWICLVLLAWTSLVGCDHATVPSPSVDLIIAPGGDGLLRQVSIRSGKIANDVVIRLPINGTVKSPVIVGMCLYALIMPSNPPFCEPGLYRIDLLSKKVVLELPLRGKALSSEYIIGGRDAVWMILDCRLTAYNTSTQMLSANDGVDLRPEGGLAWYNGDILCVTADGWLVRVEPSIDAAAVNVRKAPIGVRLLAAEDDVVLAQHLRVDRAVVAISLSGNDADIDRQTSLARMAESRWAPTAVITTGTMILGVWDDEISNAVTVRGYEPNWSIKLADINSHGNVCVLAAVGAK